jgi:hypothetical protein
MDAGYILLSRGIIESDVFASQKLLKIWVWCLCKANFKDKSVPLKIGKGETIIKVKRGSFIFGRNKAEEELFIDGSTIYKSIHKLKELQMIDITSNNQYSIISICKYDTYQNSDNYKVTSKGQVKNNQVTSKEQPSNTTKNVNNDNKENNINIDVFSFYDSLILLGAEKQLIDDWLKVRKTKKATNTETAFKKFKKEFEASGYSINEVLEKCVEKSWSGFNSDWYKKDTTFVNQNGVGKTNQKLMLYDD